MARSNGVNRCIFFFACVVCCCCALVLTENDHEFLLADLVQMRLGTADVGSGQIQVRGQMRQHHLLPSHTSSIHMSSVLSRCYRHAL